MDAAFAIDAAFHAKVMEPAGTAVRDERRATAVMRDHAEHTRCTYHERRR